MFLRVMFWKEWREQRLQATLLVGLGVLVLAVVFPLLRGDLDTVSLTPMAAAVFAWACGMVTGAIALASESETRTQTFLDYQPRPRSHLWGCKLFAALVIVAIQSVVLATAAAAATPLPGSSSSGTLSLECLFAGVFGVGCGLIGSAIAGTVLAAIGWAVIALFLCGLITLLSGSLLVSTIAPMLDVSRRMGEATLLMTWFAVIPLPIVLSGLIYGSIDRQRRQASRSVLPSGARILPAGWGIFASCWLSLRQGAPLIIGLFFSTIILAPLLAMDPILVWPLATGGIGLLMGVATLGDEQFYGSFKFLADQRLPLGRFWLMKIGLRFMLTLGIVLLLAMLGGFCLGIVRNMRFNDLPDWPSELMRLTPNLGRLLSLGLPWVLYGFAFGHLAAMLSRKSFVALAIGLMGAGLSILVWLPSMISGGMPAWQMLLIPLGVLILARMSVWAWSTERLATVRVLRGWLLALLGGLAFIAVCLTIRVREVPIVDPPFDLNDLASVYPTRDRNLVRSRLVMADERFRALVEINSAAFAELGARGSTNPSAAQGDLVLLTLIHGWPQEDEKESRLAQLLERSDWLAPLREAAQVPAMPADDPRDEALTGVSPVMRIPPLANQAAFHALYLQSRGRHAEAFGQLADLLTLARRIQTRSSLRNYFDGLAVERSALVAFRHWANHVDVPNELLRKALSDVTRHEAERPPFLEAVGGDYLRAQEILVSAEDAFTRTSRRESRWTQLLSQAAQLAPWEKARRRRMLDGFYDLWRRSAEADYTTLLNRERAAPRTLATVWLLPDGWFPAAAEIASEPMRQRLIDYINTDLVMPTIIYSMAMSNRDTARFGNACEVAALRVHLALRLFQQQNGQSADRLSDLVPKFLESIPIDPFSGKKFQYRVATKEESITWKEEIRTGDPNWEPPGAPGIPDLANRVIADGSRSERRRVPAGVGIIWSVGPDGFDDGGRRQYRAAIPGQSGWHPITVGEDMIFLVDPIKK